jgi:hypothetical protein
MIENIALKNLVIRFFYLEKLPFSGLINIKFTICLYLNQFFLLSQGI